MMSLLYLQHKTVALMQKVKVPVLQRCSLHYSTTSHYSTFLHLYLLRFCFYIRYWGKKTRRVLCPHSTFFMLYILVPSGDKH